jgi:hypothetical protein
VIDPACQFRIRPGLAISLCLAFSLAVAPARAELAAPAANTQAPATTPSQSTRSSRRVLVAAVGKGLLPTIGADLSMHIADRFALGIQASTILLALNANAYGRFVFIAERTSGYFVDLSLHSYSAIMNEGTWGPGLEVGWERRRISGFTMSFTAGLVVIRRPPCHDCTEEEERLRGPWRPFPLLSIRLGKAYCSSAECGESDLVAPRPRDSRASEDDAD